MPGINDAELTNSVCQRITVQTSTGWHGRPDKRDRPSGRTHLSDLTTPATSSELLIAITVAKYAIECHVCISNGWKRNRLRLMFNCAAVVMGAVLLTAIRHSLISSVYRNIGQPLGLDLLAAFSKMFITCQPFMLCRSTAGCIVN